MHEAGAVARALEAGLAASTRGGPPRRVTLVIRDPLRAEAGSVRFYAAHLLAERGMGDARVVVRVRPATCELCGARCRPTPSDPFCPECRAPLRPAAGPALTAHAASPGPEAAPCA
jgi:hypothetical protein